MDVTQESSLVGFRVATVSSPDDFGDFNHNGVVDAADYVVWRNSGGSASDFELWRAHFGESLGSEIGSTNTTTVPEPAALAWLFWIVTAAAIPRPKR